MLQQFESIRTKQDKISGFYREASDAVAKLNKKEPDGLWIPNDVTGSSLQEVHGIGSRRMAHESQLIERMGQTFARALTATNFTTGGALVGTELLAGSLIELLLNAIRFLDGVTYLGGLVGNIAIPRVTGPTANSYWLPEGGTVSGADMTFAQLALVPHRLAATMAYDKQLVAQASLSVEALVRNYIARIMAVEKNRAMINGSGTNGQPLGLLNIPGVQVLNFATSGSPTFAEIVKFETAIETANADIGPMSWLTSPPVKGNLKSTAVVLTGATTVASVPIWKDDEVNGYPATATQNVPNNLVIMGVGSEYVVADWAGIDMVVNPYSLDLSGQIRLTVQQWTDNSVRHELAFCVSGNAGA
jgi:HK97 family phage major capsid protein